MLPRQLNKLKLCVYVHEDYGTNIPTYSGFFVLPYQFSLNMKPVKYLRNTDVFEVSSLVYIYFLTNPTPLKDE
jgi:hypothetical protein